MLQGIVIYYSRYGATEAYARYVSEALDVPYTSFDEVSAQKLAFYDYVIIGCPVYAGRLKIGRWLNNHLSVLRRKKLFLFTVSGIAPAQSGKLSAIVQQNIAAELVSRMEVFHFHGRLRKNDLRLGDRMMLEFGSRLAGSDEDARSMMCDFDNVREDSIGPLTEAVDTYLQQRRMRGHEPVGSDINIRSLN